MEHKASISFLRGVNALGEGVQSLWHSHAHEETKKCEEGSGSISGIKCKGGRLRNGELVVAVARYMLNEHPATAENISEYFSVTTRSVNAALKKIRDRLDAGLAIPGLSETETESVFRALAARDRLRKDARAGKREAEAVWNSLIGVMREYVVCRMFEEGYRIADIAGAAGAGKRKVRKTIEKVYNISDLIVELYREGRSIQQISDLFDVPGREIKNALKAAGYNLKTLKQFACMESDRRAAGTIKPAKPRSKRTPLRRAATVSREGLADWNRLHYDDSGRLRLPYGCAPPADLPRKFPSTKALVLPAREPVPSFYPAPPPERAECTRRAG
ncbi:MAG: hypothetical protein K6T65_03005 [Peptococcaceae bacterium]|nr:hypothetical protein [Peptococcaceae bacterium]